MPEGSQSADDHGLPLTITGPNGTLATLTYDELQRFTSSTAGGETTELEYWPTGLLKKGHVAPHKIGRYQGAGAELVEPFRRADWIDVSRGLLTFGLPRELLREVFARWPNAGFHRRLVQLTLREACAHPLRPVPVLKW